MLSSANTPNTGTPNPIVDSCFTPAAATRFGLNRTDQRALDLIRGRERTSPVALARELGITTGGVTTVIDRLERAGYLRRVADESDHRRLVLEPTARLAELEAATYGPLVADTLQTIEAFSDAELATIGTYLGETRAVIAAAVERLLRDHDR